MPLLTSFKFSEMFSKNYRKSINGRFLFVVHNKNDKVLLLLLRQSEKAVFGQKNGTFVQRAELETCSSHFGK